METVVISRETFPLKNPPRKRLKGVNLMINKNVRMLENGLDNFDSEFGTYSFYI